MGLWYIHNSYRNLLLVHPKTDPKTIHQKTNPTNQNPTPKNHPTNPKKPSNQKDTTTMRRRPPFPPRRSYRRARSSTWLGRALRGLFRALWRWLFWSPGKRWYYGKYLPGEHWSSFRAKVYARDGFACRNCRGTDRLSPHHSAEGYRRLGRERIDSDDVVTLCWPCHRAMHRSKLWFNLRWLFFLIFPRRSPK
jgi:hypothetical protein